MQAQTTSFKQWKKSVLQDPEIRREYDALQPEFAVAEAVLRARIALSLSQKELATKIGTKQSAISRIESGNANPSLSFLKKIAESCNASLEISFNPR